MTQKSITHHMFPCLVLLAALVSPPARAAAPSCFADLAATRNYTLGAPARATPAPDGRSVLFLRSAPRDTRLGLYQYSLQTHTERALALPAAGPEHLSVQEKALRERTRMTLTGITDYAISDAGDRVLVAQGPKLATIDLPSGVTRPVPGEGWIAPVLSPDGRSVAGVRDNDVHVVDLARGADTQLTHGGTDVVTNGLVDFAAAEELERASGLWWSPDSSRLLYEQADSSSVETHYIADPEHPQSAPVSFRYPRAGTENAKLRLGLIARGGGPTTWISWDHDTYPYVGRVVWQADGKLTLVLLTRLQTKELVVAVDPDTGQTTPLLSETDSAWLNLSPEFDMAGGGARPLPYWLPGGAQFLWAGERGGIWQLELRHADGSLDHAVSPRDVPYVALTDVDPARGVVTFVGRPDRIDTALYQVKLAGGAAARIGGGQGLVRASAGEHQHAILAAAYSRGDGTAGTEILDAGGHVLASLASMAEVPKALPSLQLTTSGAAGLDTAILRPHDFHAGTKYPVILYVYAGPGVKTVLRAPRTYFEEQCLADQGFIVVSLDGRGTPGRDRDFERATKNDLIDLPLADQVEGLQSLTRRFAEMDGARVGVAGWSFGGYFTAMATIRRPDIFKVGVAGAPVVDFADYDTAYTERYLGMPDSDSAGYAKSNVLTYAAGLARPLLIMHGLTDDNVYFENSVKLTQALLAAGKPYNLLLLPGTHLLPDPLLRMRVNEARAAFLKRYLQ